MITLNNNAPIYEQIINQFSLLIDAGVLNVEEKMPSVRELAIELGINPNTVLRSYLELEKRGYITASPKRGYYVRMRKIKKEDVVTNKVLELIALARDNDVGRETLKALVEKNYEDKDND